MRGKNEDDAFLVKFRPIINEIIETLAAMDTQTIEKLVPLWKAWVAKLGTIKPNSDVVAGVKGYASTEACELWQKTHKGRTQLLGHLPSILAIMFKNTTGNVLLAAHIPNDVTFVINEFNIILLRCGRDHLKLLYVPDADLVDKFHTSFTTHIPAGIINYVIFKVIIDKIRDM